MLGNDEITKTATQIAEWDSKKKKALVQIENDKQLVQEADQQLHNLANKMKNLVGQFTYDYQPPKRETKTEYRDSYVATQLLGPVVYGQKLNSIRQKVLEWATNQPFVDTGPTLRYLEGVGYRPAAAKSVLTTLKKYLLEHGYTENSNGQLIPSKELKLDLRTAKPEDKQILLNHIK